VEFSFVLSAGVEWQLRLMEAQCCLLLEMVHPLQEVVSWI
jgi:hypothetical protein